ALLPANPRRLFVTSIAVAGNLGGLAGADASCDQPAAAAGLTRTYVAWLSDASTTPAARMPHDVGPYTLVTGVVIATNWADLTDGTLAWPIGTDESGAAPIGANWICTGGEVWSNST